MSMLTSDQVPEDTTVFCVDRDTLYGAEFQRKGDKFYRLDSSGLLKQRSARLKEGRRFVVKAPRYEIARYQMQPYCCGAYFRTTEAITHRAVISSRYFAYDQRFMSKNKLYLSEIPFEDAIQLREKLFCSNNILPNKHAQRDSEIARVLAGFGSTQDFSYGSVTSFNNLGTGTPGRKINDKTVTGYAIFNSRQAQLGYGAELLKLGFRPYFEWLNSGVSCLRFYVRGEGWNKLELN